MADLSDVTLFVKNLVVQAVYPNGTGQPSVAAMDCRIAEGWPNAAKLDLDVSGMMLPDGATIPVPRPGGVVANVTVFPSGTSSNKYQILDDVKVITQPTYGMSVGVAGNVVTVSGQPNANEFLTLILDFQTAISRGGANTAAILAALAADAITAGYTALATSTTLTINIGRSLVARQGGVGLLGNVTHRQAHDIMVTIWAPTHDVRSTLAKAIDQYIKAKLTYTFPDTSMMTLIYSRTNVTDEAQMNTIYRRDLLYTAEFATLNTFPGTVITSVGIPLTVTGPGGNAAPVNALA